MAYKSGIKGGNRNFGLDGPGKGSADRTSDRKKFVEGFNKIIFPIRADGGGFVKRGNRLVKKYS